MKNKSKWLWLIAIITAVGFIAVSCDNNNTHTHNWGEWSIYAAATCQTAGEESRSCSGCNETEIRETTVNPGAHHWQYEAGANIPTCMEAGSGNRHCTVDGCTEISIGGTYPIDPDAHAWQYDVGATIPTCVSAGSGSRHCTIEGCGATGTSDASYPALGHDFDNWNITKAATCTANGNRERNCLREGCGEEEIQNDTANVPRLGHLIANWTAANPQSGTQTCNNGCGNSYNLAQYIQAHSAEGTAADPVTLKVSINLGAMGTAANGWTQLLAALNTGGKLVILDLSDSYRSSDGAFITGSSSSTAVPGLAGLNRITSLVIPNTTITEFGNNNNAFTNCTNLTRITIPASVTGLNSSSFVGCTNLTSFIVDTANQNFAGQNGILYNKTMTEIICFPSASGNVTIPNNVTSIGIAFYRNTNLTSVTIPASITSISNSAFEGCTALTSVIIPASVTSIGNYAFEGCTALTGVIIPASITSIGNYAFLGCTSLTSVIIPASVMSIGHNAFQRCTNLTLVTLERWMPADSGTAITTTPGQGTFLYPFGDGTAANTNSALRIEVPVGSVSAYRSANWANWNASIRNRIHAVGCSNPAVNASCTDCE